MTNTKLLASDETLATTGCLLCFGGTVLIVYALVRATAGVRVAVEVADHERFALSSHDTIVYKTVLCKVVCS